MNVFPTAISEVLELEPEVYTDDRGFFYESFNGEKFLARTAVSTHFVQDNHAQSRQFVLRGLHYQLQHPQGKLLRVIVGQIFDVAVDIRRSSPTFGQWVGRYLSAENRRQLWIPPGFAHGYLALSEVAEVLYKTTDYHWRQDERCILWNDPDLRISWPLTETPILSERDRVGTLFRDAEVFA
ncbi:MAG: dTDP-4-dehydrorhamnose 3,5-epimerase [Leptolyngbyaceae cyanobacterium SM2_5_2]|nr:dTDP-4-dehydrorhamnose 3,5-epimerase [Leptolyngbyaceae cyanobacterium SM2_5_2]